MKLSRLSGRKQCDELRAKGANWKGRHLWVRWLPGSPRKQRDLPGVYVGTIASAKLDKSAVRRNRMRRRCLEALRLALRERANMRSVQLLLYPRSSSLTCDFAELRSDVHSFLSSLT